MTKLIYDDGSSGTFEIEAAEAIAHLKKQQFKHWQVNGARTWESETWERVQSAGEGPERALSVLVEYPDGRDACWLPKMAARMASELLADGLGVVHCRTCDERHPARELQQEEWLNSAWPMYPDYAKGIDWSCRNGHRVLHLTTESDIR